VLHAQGKFEESSVALEKSLKLKPSLFPSHLFQGINYCKLGRPARAVPLLTKAAVEQPANKQVRFWLGSALVAAGKPEQAVLELEKAAEVLPDDVDILHLLGEAYQKAARDQTAQVKTMAPDSIERRLLLAEGYLTQQEWMAAEFYYTKLMELRPPPAGVHQGLGTASLRLGKIDGAAQQFQDELKLDPYAVGAYCGLAEALLLKGNLAEALENLRRALAIRPEQARASLEPVDSVPQGITDALRARYQAAVDPWRDNQEPAAALGLALAQARLGRAEEAQKQLQSLAGAAPANSVPEPDSKVAALECMRKRQYEAAAAGLAHHLATQPRDVEARLALARCNLETHNPVPASRELRRVLDADPKQATARILLGKAYRDLALLTLDRVVSLAPDSYRTHELLGEMYEAKHLDDKAIAEYRMALETRASLPGLHLGIGRVHLKNLRFEEAAAEYEKELEINPYDADANTDLGGIYLNQDQPAKAIPLLERAARVQPTLLEVQRRLGKAYYNVGQYVKAESALKLALKEDEDGSTHYLLARTYKQLGKTREAEETLQMVSRIKSANLKAAQDRAEKARENIAPSCLGGSDGMVNAGAGACPIAQPRS
jgi:tetratricopeptide (TPR) repeat protein